MDSQYIYITLAWPEILLAIFAGVMRRVYAIRNEFESDYGELPIPSWTQDINGCIAELVIAKFLNMFWSGTVGRLDLPDVGLLQVRSKIEEGHRLVIKESDKDEEIFISVQLAKLPLCRIDGWMVAKECKRTEWCHVFIDKKGKTKKRWFVPNEVLRDPNQLKAIANGQKPEDLGGEAMGKATPADGGSHPTRE